MTTYEVYLIFKRYTDEPDQSFMSDSEAALFLKLGYAEFLRFVDDVNPVARLRGTQVVLNNAISYDLSQNGSTSAAAGSPSVLGPNPNITTDNINWRNHGRMTRLIDIYDWNPTNNTVNSTYQIVQEANQLRNSNAVVWQGNTLTFSGTQSRTIMLMYNYEQEIGFPAIAAGAVAAGQPSQSWSGVVTQATGVVINDDFNAWHDMIALFAYAQYAIVDAASNQQLMMHLESRKTAFRDYLMQRSWGATTYVHQTSDPSDMTIYIA